MEQEAQSRFEKSFTELEGDQMDEIITAFQKDEVEMQGVAAGFFFRLLRSLWIVRNRCDVSSDL